MEIKGLLQGKVGSKTGTSQRTGNAWQNDEWLLYIPGRYEKRIKFDVRGVDRCKQWDQFYNGMTDAQKNEPVKVQFEIDAEQFEGKWYNRVEAWDISMAGGW